MCEASLEKRLSFDGFFCMMGLTGGMPTDGWSFPKCLPCAMNETLQCKPGLSFRDFFRAFLCEGSKVSNLSGWPLSGPVRCPSNAGGSVARGL